MPDFNDSETLQIEADRFKLLGHLVRLQILDILRRNPECVCHLQAMLHKPQPYISQQLRVLREAGIIADTKDGLNVYYHLIDPKTASYLDTAFEPAQTVAGGEREPVAGCSCPKCHAPEPVEIRLID
jgi:ArsR family transcriptional regulator